MISYLRLFLILIILLILVLNVFLATRTLSKSNPLTTNEKTITMISNIVAILLFIILAVDIYRSSISKKGSARDQINNLNEEIRNLKIKNANLQRINDDFFNQIQYSETKKYNNR